MEIKYEIKCIFEPSKQYLIMNDLSEFIDVYERMGNLLRKMMSKGDVVNLEYADLYFERSEAVRENFWPSIVLFEFFHGNSTKREIGLKLSGLGFLKKLTSYNGKQTQGYYLKVTDNRNFFELNRLRKKHFPLWKMT